MPRMSFSERMDAYARLDDMLSADADASPQVKKAVGTAIVLVSDMHDLLASIADSLVKIANPIIKDGP